MQMQSLSECNERIQDQLGDLSNSIQKLNKAGMLDVRETALSCVMNIYQTLDSIARALEVLNAEPR